MFVFSPRLWLLLPLTAYLAACQGLPPPGPQAEGEADGPPALAVDEFLVRLPEPARGLAAMDALRGRLAGHGATIRHTYSARVGLDDTLDIRIEPQRLAALLAEAPEFDIRPAALRYLSGCGDDLCDGDEPATAARGSTCSIDCGVPPPRAQLGELTNSFQTTTVGADAIWAQTRGDSIQVCVLDSGYDGGPGSHHPDQPEHLVGGYSFPDHSPDFRASSEHGTHVVGILAAPHNGTGLFGVAPGVSVRVYKIFQLRDGRLSASDGDIIAALDAALVDGCQLLSMSFGGPVGSEFEHLALRRAYQAGLLLVAASGNGENATTNAIRTAHYYPAAYPEVLSVGATTAADELAAFSSTGPTVALTAPGVAVYSSVPVGSGDREATVSCQRPGHPPFDLSAYIPLGASGTPIHDAPLASCGYGSLADIAACLRLPSGPGHLALIQRGPVKAGQTALPFSDKIHNARERGAAGVILYNHRAGAPEQAGALLTDIDIGGGVPVPVVALAAGDGERLAELLATGVDLRCSLGVRASDYAVLSGTSMATPVVSGVAALVWSRLTRLSNVELRQLLTESAVDLGAPGRDDAFGWGRVDAVRALAQASPRARCGDGNFDRGSELCDGNLVDGPGATCDERGFDGVAGGAVVCNRACTGLDDSGCLCVPGRGPFDLRLSLLHGYIKGNVPGTLAFYHVSLGGQPVRGASARVTIRPASGAPGDVRQTTVGPSGADGSIPHFLPEFRSGLPPGDYDVAPIITKGAARCRDDQPLPPFRIHISG